jgi:chaperonin GroES
LKIVPLRDRVIIQPKESSEEIKSGIIIPEIAKEKPSEGTVLSVGEGRMTDEGKVLPMILKQGDKVLYGKFSGIVIKVEGKELVVVKEDDILARVEE